jgi:hypothetical protein
MKTATRKTNRRLTAKSWSWTECSNWRERVARLRSPRDLAAVKAFESDPCAANVAVATSCLAGICTLAAARGMRPMEMIQNDMPEMAKWLGVPFFGAASSNDM